ncbi:DUF6531 domain-containing protein [Corynebacterium matruchotii]|uniref:DUF6531 domain-containing protein n=1 Tax=Corynebacterium matruchotii TaxID=43768 RepID=UPI0028893A53|nr:DUF6531 domain-containing protein [Corynebacterium matruchotii]
MPVSPLPVFLTYEMSDFHIGGNTAEVFDFARRWKIFAENALTCASNLRSISDGGFLGSEGDRYREIINDNFPSHLTTTGNAHNGVSKAVTKYAEALTSAQTRMKALVSVASVNHATVQAAVTRYNACEINVIRAAATAKTLTTTAFATAAVPGVNVATASAASTAQADLASAKVAYEAAKAEYTRAQATFKADLVKGKQIKTALSTEVDSAVFSIRSQAKKRFEENPGWFREQWEKFKDWVGKHADIIGMIADALQLIGGLIAMIPLPVFTAIGATLMGIGVGLKVTLAATGHGSWTSCAFDAVTTFVPGGKLLKAGKNALKGTKTMKTLSKASKAAKGKFKKMASKVSSRGNKCKRPGLEPVDMATGEMINFVTDVHIDGMLPMVVDRNNSSDLDTSMVFGPGWNTTLDCRIEVLSDKILMMSPDGALLEFPTAPADGAEVVANGRPWRLSFVDGAYRVRNIQEGITWVFAVTGSEFGDRRPNAPIQDFTVTGDTPKNYVYLVDGETGEVTHMTRTIEDADLTDGGEHVRAVSNSFVNVLSPGSVADTFGLGVEIYLSSIVHHSGAWIEYDYEQTTGHLVSMRRSDGTTLEFKWHNRIDRLLSIWVKNEETHPDEEPMRLASYNYDGKGRLLKVINSAAGALRYYYDDENRPCRWTDRNGHSYYYRFDEQGRVISQVGSGGMFPNVAVWLPDTGDDAPEDGVVCVALECVGEFHGEPTEIGDSCINEYFDRLDKLPLANLLREKGLVGAGLTGRGRTGVRDDESWTIPDELLHDEFLGDIRPTVYRSTPEGDVWRIIDAEGSIVDREYNQYHQIIRDVSNTGVVTSIDRDEYGTITQIDYGDGTTETITPGAWGEPVRVIGRDGLTTEYELDSAGFITATTYSTGARIEYEYEWRASGLVPLAVIDPQGLVQVTECDNAGRPLASVDPAGRRSSVIRDVRGLVTEIIDPIGNVTKVEYSPEGWVTKVINPDGSEQTMVYDGEGNQIETIDEVGTRTVVKHTVFDKVQEVLAANGGVTRYTYNTQMEPIAITNADGHTWRFEYDLAGNIVKEIDYNGLVTETRRSPDGLRLDTIDGEGTVTTVYDAMGQVTELHEADGVVKFTRDQYGEVTQITNKWSTVDYHHDEYGRLASETTTLYSGEQSALEYHYSAAGAMNAVTHVLPDGREVTETPTYDEHGQLQQMTYGVAGQELASTSFGVDDAGRQSWLSVGSMVRQFKFDQRDRIISDTVMRLGGEAATTNIVDRVFSWRADNALTQVTNNVHNSVTDYTVDVLNHVTGVTHVGAAQDQKSSESYEFSRAGMVTKLHPDASAKWADDVDSYGGTMPRQVGRTTFTYDKAGRVTQTVTKRLSKKPLVKHFYYGSGTQPVGYEDSDHPGVGWRYLYDGLDRRVGKEQINTATGDVLSRTVFMHYGNELFGEQYTVDVNEPHMVGVGALWPVNPITDEILGQIELVPSGSPDSAFYAMISDFAGAPKELVDVTTGGIVGYSKQSLFGKRQWFGGKSSPLLFAGQYEDAESGWVYNRFRYYNTTFGMYNAQDPLGVGPNVASAQAYVDNPTTWVDAMGLAAHKVKSGTPPFVLRAHNKGVVGEHAVDNIIKRSGGKGIGKRVTYVDANGAKRISDGSVGKNLVEVKNVKSQGYSSQIHAAVEKSVERGGKLDLYVARGTKVSPTIRNHPNINLHRIPRRDIVQASKEVFHHPTKTILHY